MSLFAEEQEYVHIFLLLSFMPDLATLLNEKNRLKKQMIIEKNDFDAVAELKKRIQRIEEQIKKLRGD